MPVFESLFTFNGMTEDKINEHIINCNNTSKGTSCTDCLIFYNKFEEDPQCNKFNKIHYCAENTDKNVPSKYLPDPWVTNYSKNQARIKDSGKWLLFYKMENELDNAWSKFCELFNNNQLPGIVCAKCSTLGGQSQSKNKNMGVIVCYCSNSANESHVKKAGKNLMDKMEYCNKFGKVYYKTDEQTRNPGGKVNHTYFLMVPTHNIKPKYDMSNLEFIDDDPEDIPTNQTQVSEPKLDLTQPLNNFSTANKRLKEIYERIKQQDILSKTTTTTTITEENIPQNNTITPPNHPLSHLTNHEVFDWLEDPANLVNESTWVTNPTPDEKEAIHDRQFSYLLRETDQPKTEERLQKELEFIKNEASKDLVEWLRNRQKHDDEHEPDPETPVYYADLDACKTSEEVINYMYDNDIWWNSK